MLYAILCYDREDVIAGWTQGQEDETMERLIAVQERLAAKGRLGPVARLLPTTSATTLRKGAETMVLDGPFAETKEQLLGFYVVDVDSLDEAVEFSRDLAQANNLAVGCYEIRPLSVFRPGNLTP